MKTNLLDLCMYACVCVCVRVHVCVCVDSECSATIIVEAWAISPFFNVNILDLRLHIQRFELSAMGSSYAIILQMVIDTGNANIVTAIKYEVEHCLSICIYKFHLGPFSRSRSWIEPTLVLPSNMKSHIGFPLAYLYLTLDYSQGQAHFDLNSS